MMATFSPFGPTDPGTPSLSFSPYSVCVWFGQSGRSQHGISTEDMWIRFDTIERDDTEWHQWNCGNTL